MTEANARRGEVSLMLEGDEYVMRPSMEAIEQVERETDDQLMPLLNAASGGALSQKKMAIIVCRFIQAWGKQVGNPGAAGANPSRILEMIYESEGGQFVVMLALTQVLTGALTGGYTKTGEVKDRIATTPSILSDDLRASA